MKQPEINCSYDELRASITLQPHPRNPNTHSDEQIKLLAKIIQHQGWRNPVVVSKLSGFIVAGHGRLKAAELLGLDEVPVDLQEFKTEADELAHLVADNRIAELAEINRAELADLIVELDNGAYDMEMTGFEVADLEELMTAAPPEFKGEVTTLEAEWEAANMPEYDGSPKGEGGTVIVHFLKKEDRVKFADSLGVAMGVDSKYIWYPCKP